jgi:V8-like Glu-specific endopeptidase
MSLREEDGDPGIGETAPFRLEPGLESVPGYTFSAPGLIRAWLSRVARRIDPSRLAPGWHPLVVIRDQISGDDRIQVQDTRPSPWRWICDLAITAADGSKFHGTGWLVSPRAVITAGHCVYKHEHGGFVQRVTVSPGRRGDFLPYEAIPCDRVDCSQAWRDTAVQADYGVVFLPEGQPVAEGFGNFGYADLDSQDLANLPVSLAGYPGDKPTGTLWYHERPVRRVTTYDLFHEIDTFHGQSGAPLWRVKENGVRQVVGIHVAGEGMENRATRINDEVFEEIKAWKKQSLE